jgi:HK97 family phage major capsid protein
MDFEENVKELLEGYREDLVKELKSASEKDNAKRDEKSEKTVNELTEKLNGLDKKIEDVFKVMKERSTNLGMEKKDRDKFKFSKAMYGIMTGDWSRSEYEHDVMKEAGQKAIDTNMGAGGSFIIPQELSMERIIEPAIAQAVMQKMGADFSLKGLTADVILPESTSRPSLTFGADGATVTAEDITFGDKKLTPKYGKMLTKVSNNLMIQQPAAENYVMKQMRDGVQIGLDQYAIIGTGSASQPLGILNTPGTQTTDIGSVRMTVDNVMVMKEVIEELDFEPDGLLTRAKVKSGLLRERVAQYSGDTGGALQQIPWGAAGMSAIEEFLGMKIGWTSNVPVASNLTNAVVGPWGEFMIAMWGNIRMKASDVAGTALSQDQTWIAMYVNMDTLCRRPTAFNIASNVSTNF